MDPKKLAILKKHIVPLPPAAHKVLMEPENIHLWARYRVTMSFSAALAALFS